MASKWSSLPQELLCLICKKLHHIADHLRFRKVCRSWRYAAKAAGLPPQPPCMLLPYEEETTARSFLYLSDMSVRTVNLPEARNKRFYQTSQGWLLMLGLNPEVSLFNPITRALIRLPLLTMIPKVLDFDRSRVFEEYLIWREVGMKFRLGLHEMRDSFITKVVMSCDPNTSGGDCVVMVSVFDSWSKLFFCRPGDKSWTTMELELHNIADFAYCRGRFYAIGGGSKEQVVVFDVSSSVKLTGMVAVSWEEDIEECHLVEYNGQLFLFENVGAGEEDFSVFRLDLTTKPKWSNVGSIGSAAVFLCENNSLSIACHNVSGCRKNCIYYPNFYGWSGYRERNLEGHDLGMFDIQDGSFRLLPFNWKYNHRVNAVWFKPTL